MSIMFDPEPTTAGATGMPRTVKLGLGFGLALLAIGAAYLYAVRGYAILLDEHSQSLVRSVQQAPAGTQLRAVLADGRLRLRVETGD